MAFVDPLYGPESVGEEHYVARSVAPAAVARHEGRLSESAREGFTEQVAAANPANLPASTVTRHVRFDGQTAAMAGDFERAATSDALADAGFGRDGTYRGFDVYRRRTADDVGEDRFEYAALGDGRLLWAARSSAYAGQYVLEAAADTVTANRERYDQEDDGFASVARHLRGGDATVAETFYGYTGPRSISASFNGMAAAGAAVRFDGPSVHRRYAFVFSGNREPNHSGIRAWANTATAIGDPDVPTSDHSVDGIDIDDDERDEAVVLSWSQPTASLGAIED